jgi:hypothetical protein
MSEGPLAPSSRLPEDRGRPVGATRVCGERMIASALISDIGQRD